MGSGLMGGGGRRGCNGWRWLSEGTPEDALRWCGVGDSACGRMQTYNVHLPLADPQGSAVPCSTPPRAAPRRPSQSPLRATVPRSQPLARRGAARRPPPAAVSR